TASQPRRRVKTLRRDEEATKNPRVRSAPGDQAGSRARSTGTKSRQCGHLKPRWRPVDAGSSSASKGFLQCGHTTWRLSSAAAPGTEPAYFTRRRLRDRVARRSASPARSSTPTAATRRVERAVALRGGQRVASYQRDREAEEKEEHGAANW